MARASSRPVIVIGSANKDKAAELERLLADLKVRVLTLDAFSKAPKVAETGRTFEANACKKARAYSKLSDHLTLADDSGLCVRALNNRPGVYSARFAGPGCDYLDNNKKLLRLLKGKPAAARAAFFCSTVALYRRGRKIKVIKGICRGRIAEAMLGTNGFGFDPTFIPAGSRKTFAQMTPAQKNAVSHRARALTAVKKYLKKNPKLLVS
jgi:XTP/dITP diphosphohydrolase